MLNFRMLMPVVIVAILATWPVSAQVLILVDPVTPRAREGVTRFERLRDPQAQTDSLRTWFDQNGFLDAEISVKSDTVRVNAGSQFVLSYLAVTDSGTRMVTVNRPLTPVNLDHASENVLKGYRDRGFYFARLSLGRWERHDTSVTINATVQQGPRVTIGEVRLEGSLRTRPQLLERYFREYIDEPLSASAIARAKKTATQIPNIRVAGEPRIEPRPGYAEADVVIPVTEPNQWSLFGGIGFLPQPERTLTWDIRGEARNLFGEAKSIALHSERRGVSRTDLTISYRQPVFWIGTGTIGGSLATRDYRDRFYEFAVSTNYELQLGVDLRSQFALQYGRVEPSEDSTGFSRYSVTAGFSRSSLDDSWNPRSGLAVNSSVSYVYRQYRSALVKRAVNETRTSIGMEWYATVRGAFVMRVSARYAGYQTEEDLPPLSELYLLGGPGTIRGFRSDQFEAQQYVLTTIEPRLRFSSGYLAMFYDLAWIRWPLAAAEMRIERNESTRHGFGIGMGLSSEQVAVVLQAGWNPDSSLDDPQLSVQLRSDF